MLLLQQPCIYYSVAGIDIVCVCVCCCVLWRDSLAAICVCIVCGLDMITWCAKEIFTVIANHYCAGFVIHLFDKILTANANFL